MSSYYYQEYSHDLLAKGYRLTLLTNRLGFLFLQSLWGEDSFIDILNKFIRQKPTNEKLPAQKNINIQIK